MESGTAMKALITGHEGFVGRHFTTHLRERGYDITGIDLKSGQDCRDYFRTCEEQFDLVVHLAAIVGGRQMIEGQPLTVATDLSIDSEMFNWALRTRQRRIVYYSSSAAYPKQYQKGDGTEQHLREDMIDLEDIRTPDETYGWAKLSGEMLAGYLNRAGIPTHILRPMSGYGTDQDLTYPFPSLIEKTRQRMDPFEIWGNGQQVRDWVHIDDVIRCTMAVVDADYRQPVNIGWGIPVPFLTLAGMMFDIAGWRPSEILTRPDMPSGCQYRCGDPARMMSIYRPNVILEEGITRALNGIL
jgi:nucleoside-diphosphate-sugar epimerase